MKAFYAALGLMILSATAAQAATAPYPSKMIQLVTGSRPAGAADMNQAPMNFIKEGQHERD